MHTESETNNAVPEGPQSVQLPGPLDKALLSSWGPHLARICILLLAVWRGWTLRGFFNDDTEITWRVARNLAEGHGMVYNVGQHYQATSGPGYAAVLALIARIGSPAAIPFTALLLSVIGLAFMGLALYEIGASRKEKLSGFFAALFAVTSPFIYQAFLSEVLPQIALVLWAFYFALRKGPDWYGYMAVVLLSLAALARADALLAFPIVGLVYFLRTRRIVRETLLGVAILLPFALWSRWYYGAFLAPTMAAKIAQTTGHINPTFAQGLWALVAQRITEVSPWGNLDVGKIAIFCALVSIAAMLPKRYRFWIPIVLWTIVHLAFYCASKIAFYDWYDTPVAILYAIPAGCLLSQFIRWCCALIEGANPRYLRRGLALGALLILLNYLYSFFAWFVSMGSAMGGAVQLAFYVAAIIPAALLLYLAIRCQVLVYLRRIPTRATSLAVALGSCLLAYSVIRIGWIEFKTADNLASLTYLPDRRILYRTVGRWINANLPPGSSVGNFEIGILGWEAPNVSMVDPCGLCTPGVIQFVAQGDLWFGAFRMYHPDYILINPGLTSDMAYKDKPVGWLAWRDANYRYLTTIRDNFGERIWIWRKR